MNLTKWLDYLESLPSGLTNTSLAVTKNLAKKLEVLNFTGKIITVAGTNGKSSTVIFLESILLAAGLKTCSYISPHVLNYNERIRLNGKEVDDETLCQAFTLVEQVRGKVILSYFEFSTLAALVIFKKQNPDILILEVGLGGRFDAVNILDSDISIITTIALEHTHILGDTREKIGYEKSGIMRPLKPTVVGENMPDSIYTAAKNLQVKLYSLGKDFFYLEKDGCWDWYDNEVKIKSLPLPCLPLVSAAIALMAIKLLSNNFRILPNAYAFGLKSAFLTGRFQQMVFLGRKIILDVAHNPEATSLLALNLERGKVEGHILAVCSMLKDKDIAESLKPLVKIVDRWYLGVLDGDRAASAEQLSKALQQAGGANFVVLPNVTASFEQAIAECQEKDKIVTFGSFHTVAEVLKLILWDC